MENMCGIKMFSAQDICKGLHVTKETAYDIIIMLTLWALIFPCSFNY